MAYILMDGRLQEFSKGRINKALDRIQRDGQTYIVAEDFEVYISHQILDLYTGEVGALWLTRDQHDSYVRDAEMALHARALDLPRIGLPRNQIKGWINPITYIPLVKDDGGHWWEVGSRDSTPRPYVHTSTAKIRFVNPWVRHLGFEEPLWVANRRGKTRLTVCTSKVSDMISETQMWGHYFPRNEAQSNVDIARAECMALRVTMVEGLRSEREHWKSRSDSLALDLAGAKDKISAMKADLVSAKADLVSVKADWESARAELAAAYDQRSDLDPDRPFDLQMV